MSVAGKNLLVTVVDDEGQPVPGVTVQAFVLKDHILVAAGGEDHYPAFHLIPTASPSSLGGERLEPRLAIVTITLMAIAAVKIGTVLYDYHRNPGEFPIQIPGLIEGERKVRSVCLQFDLDDALALYTLLSSSAVLSRGIQILGAPAIERGVKAMNFGFVWKKIKAEIDREGAMIAIKSLLLFLGILDRDIINTCQYYYDTGNGEVEMPYMTFDVARPTPPDATLSWERRAPLPTPRAWAPAVAYGGRIYVVGGVSCTSGCRQFANPSSALEVYDPGTNTWERLPPMPTARVGPAVAALNGRIYVMGGFNRNHGTEFELAVRRRVEIYDIATGTWTRGPDLLKPRAWGRAVALGNKVYVMGGVGDYTYSPGYHSAVEAYDPGTNTWSDLASFSGGRYLYTAVTANGKIYVIGGGKHDPDYTYNDIQEYNPATNTWTSKNPMPSAAGDIDAVAAGGRIWVFGSNGLCRVYDLSTDRWEETTSGHDRGDGFSMAYLNGFAYRFGGGGWGPTSGVVERVRLP